MTWHTAERFTLNPSKVSLVLRGLSDPAGHYPLTLSEIQRRARAERRRAWWRALARRWRTGRWMSS